MTHTLRFNDGTEVKAGKEVSLRKFEPDGSLNLGDRSIPVFFNAQPHETDVIARARERLKLPEKERTPFFARSIAASLEPLPAGANAPAAANWKTPTTSSCCARASVASVAPASHPISRRSTSA